MQILLAPSKTMTTEYVLPQGLTTTQPYFLEDARRIVSTLRKYDDIAALMHVSSAIADGVEKMYSTWGSVHAPALYAYKGDVYRWFFVETLSRDALRWAQERIYILSGLYGALRPLDLISPYRLEMKTKLPVEGTADLYEFWGDTVARYVDENSDRVICNLSSDEYAKVVTKWTQKRVITPVFLDNKNNGTVGTVPIYSKMMRGVMARWIIDNRIDSAEDLTAFKSQGYAYSAARSTVDAPAFYRVTPRPIHF